MYNRRYDKVFIMLKQEISGFSCSEKPASGTSSIEIKSDRGKLTTYVQGLGKFGGYGYYDIYFISSTPKHTIGVNIGRIDVDDIGNGSSKWEFQPDNVGGTGLAVEEFNIVAVFMKNGKNQNSLVVPIVGYRDSKINWKSEFSEFSGEGKFIKPQHEIKETNRAVIVKEPYIVDDKEVINKPEIIAASINKPIFNDFKLNDNEDLSITQNISTNEISSKYVEKSDFYCDFKDMPDEKDPHKTFKDLTVKFNRELKDLEEAGILSMGELEKINNAGKMNSEKSDIEYMFLNNTIMKPFNDNNNCKWIRICIEELALLPFESCVIMNHPFIVLGYRKYKHLILGKETDNEKEKYILGIPDAYIPEYNLKASRLGFSGFRSFEGLPSEGAYGYWVMNVV